MKISLKKFTENPHKYKKKIPFIILLGDYPAMAVISYEEYKKHFLDVKPQQSPVKEIKKRNGLLKLLFD